MARKSAPDPAAFVPPVTLGVTEIAAMTGRTVRWVQILAKEQGIEREARGKYRLDSVMAGLVSHYEAILEGTEKKASASRATDARTAEIEQRMAIRDRQLIPIDDAIMAMDKVVGVANAELSGLPARISRDLGTRKKAEAEVHGARKRISDALAEMSGAARTGIGLDEAGGGVDA